MNIMLYEMSWESHILQFWILKFPSMNIVRVGTAANCNLFYYQFNLLKPTGHVMHQQFNIQQLYLLPTLYLCVLYLSETNSNYCHSINWLVFITEMKSVFCAVRTGSLNKAVCASYLKG